MKKQFLSLVCVAVLTACGNSDTTTTTDSPSGPTTPATENVDANIPDSTSTINLNKPLPVDSSAVIDSMRR